MSGDDEKPPFCDDIRQAVPVRGRVVLMRPAWRRCATGVTYDPPPSMPQRRRAVPALTAMERSVLAAISTGAHTHRSRPGVGRTAITESVTGRPNATHAQEEMIDAALLRLERLRLIVATPLNERTTLYTTAALTEDA